MNANQPTNEKSAIERATSDVEHDLNSAITHEWKANAVPVTEKEFRRILALYFADKSERDWCELFGIPAPQSRRDT